MPAIRWWSTASCRTTTPGRARAASAVGRDDRLLVQERLVRRHAEVLVDRRVENGAAARVQRDELVVGDAAREADTAVQPAVGGEPLEPRAIGPLTGDDD